MARPQIIGLIAFAMLLASTCTTAKPKAWDSDSFPNPKRDINLCGRKGRQSNICDPDGILTFEGANVVEGILKDIWDGADPYIRAPCGTEGFIGYQVAVAVMRRMDIHADEDAPAAAHRIAKALHAKWGVGSAACDNGVLLLLAVDDRQVFISTGVGSQKALPDNSLGGIIGQMKKPLRAKDYDTALEQAVVDIGLGLAGRPPAGHEWEWFPVIFFGIIAFLVLNSCWKAYKQRRQYRDCRDALKKVKDEQEKLRTKEWSRPRTCPVCLEEFTSNPEIPSAPPPPSSAPGTTDGNDDPSAPLLSSSAGLASGSTPKGEMDEPSTSSGRGAGPSSSGLRRRGSGRIEGAESGESAWKASAGGAGVERSPVTLRCGHTFCEPCLEKWLDRATTCPICREPVNGDGSHATGGVPQSSSEAQRQQVRGLGAMADNMLTAELAFRLMTLHHRYPNYITPSLVDRWSGEARETGTFDFESAREFQLGDPAVRAQHESMGRSGNTFSFGGGGGGGGGGAGGSCNYSVQLTKKKPQFDCVLCGFRQPISRIYARSNKAVDCRRICQDYNAAQGEAAQLDDNTVLEQHIEYNDTGDVPQAAQPREGPGKWASYLPSATAAAAADDEDWTIAAPAPAAGPVANKRKETRRKRPAEDGESYEWNAGRRGEPREPELHPLQSAAQRTLKEQPRKGDAGSHPLENRSNASHSQYLRSGISETVLPEARVNAPPAPAAVAATATAMGGGRWSKYADSQDGEDW